VNIPLEWTDELLLGHPAMDEEHAEFVALIRALQACPETDFEACFDRFSAHAAAHFAAEDRWMTDTAFPPRGCHMDEHAAVLQSIDEVGRRIRVGDVAEGRRLADALADWFPKHAQHLDSALAHWICKCVHGGKPVVVRRLHGGVGPVSTNAARCT
jgi:hemerythrin